MISVGRAPVTAPSRAPSGALVGEDRRRELRGFVLPQQNPVPAVIAPQQGAPRTPVPLIGAAPSINIWNNGQALRSPSPMTYADPSTDPNQGMYDLARQIDAIRERSQTANPMVKGSPTFGVIDPDRESARRLAPMLVQDAARQQNTPMNGMTAYEANPFRYNPTNPAIQARQQDNAQRATAGRPMDRTRLNPMANQINADAVAIQEGRAVRTADGNVVYHTGTPESARQAQLAGKTEREAMRNRANMNVPQSELDRREDADVARRERQARHNQFKEASGGLNYRQYDRLQSQNALTMKAVDEGRLSPAAAMFRMQTRADKALRRAGNPMAMGVANSGRLFPDLFAKPGSAQPNQNPMGSPLAAGAPNTAENIQARNSIRAGITEGVPATATTPAIPPSPFIQSLGVTADAAPADIEAGLNDMMLRGEVPSPQGLKDLQMLIGTYTETEGNSPFAGTEVEESWRELRTLPENASQEQLMGWWTAHQERVKALRQRQTEQGRLRGIGRIGA